MFPSPDPRIYCLLQSLDAHPGLAAVDPPAGLLSAAEQARFAAFSVPKRKRDWILGRWTAKHLLQSYLAQAEGQPVPLDQIEILADEDGAPYAWRGERLPLSLSISHSGADSWCAVCPGDLDRVGADIEQIEPRELAFVRTFFTPAENAAVDGTSPPDRDPLVNGIWSSKEAVLKALRLGLRVDTRRIEISVPPLSGDWDRVSVSVDPSLLPPMSSSLVAWCCIRGPYILSLALMALQ